MFDSLKYAKFLEDVGVPRNQAEAHVQVMAEVMDSNFATRQEVKDLDSKMDRGFAELDAKIDRFRAELEAKIIQSEYRLTLKLGTIVSVAIGVAVTLAKIV